MKARCILLLFMLCAVLAFSSNSALALSYFGYSEYGGTWYDAEKSPTNTEDDLMCWAAAASNVLAWTGWSGSFGNDADAIFGYYQDYWTDAGGNAYYGWDWWFDGTNDSQGAAGWSQVDVSGGGGFWTTYNFSEYYLYSSSNNWALSNLDYLLHEGYGVALGVTDDSGAHAITCWGFEYDEFGNYLGIYITDSDDDKYDVTPEDELKYYAVEYDVYTNSWYLQDFYSQSDWYITEVQGLAMMPVPEPATILLLVSGILGFPVAKRRFKN